MIGPKNIENVLHITPSISNKMANAIELWDMMYRGEAPWLRKGVIGDPVNIISLGLPAMIASEKARMAVLEMKSEITTPTKEIKEDNPDYIAPGIDEETGEEILEQGEQKITKKVFDGPEDRAKWLNETYQNKVIKKLRNQLEYAEAKGGMIIKPYVINIDVTNKDGEIEKQKPQLEVEFIQADGFFPISFDGTGNITDAAFIQTKLDKNVVYRRLERHQLVGTTVIITNQAFKSINSSDEMTTEKNLGEEIPLTNVPEWRDLKPETKIANVDRLLFAYYREPNANNIDTLSPLGCSCFSRAVSLIEQADKQYSRLLWEFEATEAAIDVDRNALLFKEGLDGRGHIQMNVMQDRLFRKIDLGLSDTFKPFLPQIRDVSLINGLNNILSRIEDVCALSRGTLSDVSNEARTATELKILKQRSFSANQDIQLTLQKTLEDVVYIMNTYATLYNLAGDVKYVNGKPNAKNIGKYDVSFEWDDSILVDVDTELKKRIQLMQNGLCSKEEVRVWYFGETPEQAKEALNKIKSDEEEENENNFTNNFSNKQFEGIQKTQVKPKVNNKEIKK